MEYIDTEITLTLRSIDSRRSLLDTGSSDINIGRTINYANEKLRVSRIERGGGRRKPKEEKFERL